MDGNITSGDPLKKKHVNSRFLNTVKRTLCAVTLGVTFSHFATAAEQADFNKQELNSFINELVKEDGFSRTDLEKLFAKAEYKTRIIELISKPAERRLTWGEYRNLFINDRRINQGVEFWKENKELLDQAAEKYGVSPAAIIGILGIETGFGRNSGGFRVVDALSTLGFGYPRRATFFKKELRSLLQLAKQQGFDPLELKGSYAGAMGIPQFMPSSYLAYAVDFDGNGQADIWNSNADAIGSIASYLSRHGWTAGEPVAARATVSGKNTDNFISKSSKPAHTLKDASKMGWKSTTYLPKSIKVRGLELDGSQGTEHWLTTNNFYVITRYNRSDLYAMAVWQLGDHVEKKLNAEKKG